VSKPAVHASQAVLLLTMMKMRRKRRPMTMKLTL
jgi:hypothetical protein